MDSKLDSAVGTDLDSWLALFSAMQAAVAICQVVCDGEGIPCDYRYLEVTPAFEALTGWKRATLLGRTTGDVTPALEQGWLESCARVAVSGEPSSLTLQAGPLKKKLQVSLFRPQKGVLVCHYVDPALEPSSAAQSSSLPAANPNPNADNPHLLDASQLAKELQKSQALFEISQTLAGTVDLGKTLQQIADAANRLTKSSSRTILHLLDESRRYLHSVAVSGGKPSDKLIPLNFRPGDGIAGLVVSSGEAINVADVLQDERYISVPGSRRANKETHPEGQGRLRALLVVPVKTGAAILGTLSVQSPIPGAFTDEDERLLTALGAQAALAIDKARLYDDLQAALQHEKATRAQLVQAEKLAALGRIVASVAHELNNPLQAIQNALYLIQMETSLPGQANDDLKTVLNETERMAGLIARLRDTYRPTTSEEYQPESLNNLVLDVQRLLSTHLRHSQITLVFTPDEKIPVFPMIRDQIKQVILNICLNAVEAMRGGGQIEIVTELHRETQSALMTISDNGPAIDPQILPLIFDPFVTTKANEGGTGLGLSITFDIVQRHMGRIEVESVADRGTTFRVWLPLEPRLPTPPGPPLTWE